MPPESRSIVWRVTVRLSYVEPEVRRTILVRPQTKLAMFHRYLQAAIGWLDYHLYMFTIGGRNYSLPNPEWDFKVYDARRYTLERLFPKLPTMFRYVYDFGDRWEHDVVIEGAEAAQYRKQYPICIDGDGACPPEDCGGPPGYEEFLAVMADPRHPGRPEMAAWARSQMYRRDFNSQAATWSMRDVQRGYR